MRDIALDNFKCLLIALVVVGHVIEPVIGRFEWAKTVYIFIYIFHMPMFAYVSGVVSSKVLDSSAARKIVTKIMIPYICLEIIYSVFDYLVFSKNTLTISPLIPYWILWYLFSLALWRIMLPVISAFRYPVLLAVIIGLACGVNTYDYNLSFSRTFVFFPFFLLGNYYHSRVMTTVRRGLSSKLIASVFIGGVLCALFLFFEAKSFNVAWLYGSRSYASLSSGWEDGVLIRSAQYLFAFGLGAAFLAVVSSRRSFLTAYGVNTLYIYVMHGFVMKGLIALGLYRYIDGALPAVGLMLASLALLPLLSLKLVKLLADNMMNPFGAGRLVLARKNK